MMDEFQGKEFGQGDYSVKCEFPNCSNRTEVTDATKFVIEEKLYFFCLEHAFQAVERGYKNDFMENGP